MPAVGSGCLVLRVACRRFWMSGVACCRPLSVLDARCCESPAGGSGCPPTAAAVRHRGASVRPGIALRPRSGPAPEPLRASPRPHPGPAPEPPRASPRTRPGTIPASSRLYPAPAPEPPPDPPRTGSRAGRTSCAGKAAVDKLSKTLAGNLPQSPRNRLFL